VVALGIGAGVSAGLAKRARARRREAASLAEALERAAGLAQAERRRFVLRLDHELKNPITAMRAAVANLEASIPEVGAPEGCAVLASIDGQLVRLSRLVADLRKVSELETRPLTLAAVQLAGVLEEVVATVAEQPGGRRVVLSLPTAPWPLPPVLGDRDLLYLAFVNLVGNAVKFSSATDTVEIRGTDDPPWVTTEVADNGIGIPADELAIVWDELARGRAARGLPGTGIGLSIARTVVARHGGVVGLRSREAEGTVVTVRLPAAPPDVAGLRHGDDSAATKASYGLSLTSQSPNGRTRRG